MSESEITSDVAKVATAAVEAAPDINTGVTTVESDIKADHPLSAAADAATALSATLSDVAKSGSIGSADAVHVNWASELAALIGKFLSSFSKL